ncbi:hypothetical protein P8452_12150 [Trifolium repens]|jgi:hypothetical protein|nr:hypothetical protein P8452_12150 [Trifolium repens]
MIDTVLQIVVQGERFDVWVVEERCSCGEERSLATEDSHRSYEKVNSNSGELGWKGGDGDLFSDGKSDSDVSESYTVPLGLHEVSVFCVELLC